MTLTRDAVSVLILCTGNSCRSQMAEGFLKKLDPTLRVVSAGTRPARQVHPLAVRVMEEIGIDIGRQIPRSVAEFTGRSFDYVITVCDGARDTCPVFTGSVGRRLHVGFEDPAMAQGSEEEIAAVFRRVRDEIRTAFGAFHATFLQHHR